MVDQFLIGAHRNFTYLITFDGQSLVIDPQGDLKPWQARMKELNSRLVGVLLTHTHRDHVEGVPEIVKQYGLGAGKPPIHVHWLDASRMDRYPEAVRSRLTFLDDGKSIEVGWEKIHVLHTPGHSAGECCFLLKTEPHRLFTGDTVFVGDVGRTDLETGSTSELFQSIQRIKTLPPPTVIYPGHHYGSTPTTTIERECRESAAFRCRSVQELDALP